MSTTVRKILEKTLGQTGLGGSRPLIDLLERIAGVDTIDELRNLPIDIMVVSYGATVAVRGSRCAYDCHPRSYIFDALSAAYDDGESVIAPLPDLENGRWVLQAPEPAGKLPMPDAHITASAPRPAPKPKRKKKTKKTDEASPPNGKKAQLPLK